MSDVSASVTLPLKSGSLDLTGARPSQAWSIDGESDSGYYHAATLPQAASGGAAWSLTVSPAPLLVELA